MSSILMSCGRLLARTSPITGVIRHFGRSNLLRASNEDLRQMVKPSDFQKFVLVRTNIYKTKEEIPDRVSPLQMKRAMDLFRGKMMIFLTALSLLGFYVMIISGRRLRESGDSLTLRGTQQEIYWREKEKARLEREGEQNNAQ